MFSITNVAVILKLLLFVNFGCLSNTAHISGTYRTSEFFKFLVKFGFQKTEIHSQRDSFGYIYGNITSKESFPVPVTFAVLDKFNFLPYYGNRTVHNLDVACQRMFSTADHFAYDAHCGKRNLDDFLRRVPCPRGQHCPDEDTAANIVPGHQFTYVINNLIEPK